VCRLKADWLHGINIVTLDKGIGGEGPLRELLEDVATYLKAFCVSTLDHPYQYCFSVSKIGWILPPFLPRKSSAGVFELSLTSRIAELLALNGPGLEPQMVDSTLTNPESFECSMLCWCFLCKKDGNAFTSISQVVPRSQSRVRVYVACQKVHGRRGDLMSKPRIRG
jgi:hypothetical protein